MTTPETQSESTTTRVAVPMLDGGFCEHFGRADAVALYEVDLAARRADQPRTLNRPDAGECESLPHWLRQLGVKLVLAGGIGPLAQQNLAAMGIDVRTGLAGATPGDVLDAFLAGDESSRANPCGDELERRHRHCRQ